MTWKLDFAIRTRRHLVALQHALGPTRWGCERFPDGSRRVHLGALEVSTSPSKR
jgi:hypothetical protein